MWNPAALTAPAAPSPTANGAAVLADDDVYGTLDLGHEAQINEDLVRAIRDEIASIDDGLRSTSASVRNEEHSSRELGRSNGGCRCEMSNHRRDAAELLDMEVMTEDVRGGFRDQFAREVAPHVVVVAAAVSPSKSSSSRDGGDDDAADARGGGNDAGGDDNAGNDAGGAVHEGGGGATATRAFSHKKFIDAKRAAAKAKSSSVRSIQREIKDANKKIRAANHDAARIVDDVKDRQLDRAKADGERQVEARRREFEAEGQRNRGVREAVQAARTNSGTNAQKIAEKSKEQMAERTGNFEKESTITALGDAKKKEMELLEEEERKLDMELAALSGQLDFMTKQKAEFQAEQKRSADMKVEWEGVQKNVAEIASAKDGKTKDAGESDADLKSAQTAFDDASKAAADAKAEKLENDCAVAKVLEPAATRKADAIKEKERLAGEAVELQKSIEQARAESKDTVSTTEANAAAKSKELEERRAELDGALADFEALKREDATAQETLEEELREYREFASKFEAATKAEVDKLDALKRERAEARVRHLEETRADNAAIEEVYGDLKRMTDYIQKKRDVKADLQSREFAFDGDCNLIEFDEDDDKESVVNEAAGSPAVKRGIV